MANDYRLGLVLGVLLATASIGGNYLKERSGRDHVLSTFPDLFSLAVIPAFLYFVLSRHRHHGTGTLDLWRCGKRIVTTGSVTFAVLFGAFSAMWFDTPNTFMILATAVGTFIGTVLFGYLAAALLSRQSEGKKDRDIEDRGE